MLINYRRFNFTSFLAKRVKSADPEQGAKQHGNAIINYDTGEIYSNIQDGDFVNIDKGLNTLTLYIPDDMQKVEYKNTVFEVVHRIYKKYGMRRIVPSYEKGEWYYMVDGQIACNNLIIASVHVDYVTMGDIEFFVSLGRFVKRNMKLKSISVGVNDAIGTI